MNTQRMFDLTKKLISIPSTTGNEEEIARYLAGHLESLGLSVSLIEVEKGRFNLVANFPDKKPRLLFNTHLDTVPPQYGPSENDKRIYGRGACDTHGILAAWLEAMIELGNEGIKELGLSGQ